MKKQEVCQKSINKFNQNKRHELGKLMILVSLTPWKKIVRNRGAKCSSRGKTMSLHSKIQNETLNRVSKRIPGAERSKLQAYKHIRYHTSSSKKFNSKSWAPVSGHGLHPLIWLSIKGTTSEALAPEVPTLKYLRLKFGSYWWSKLFSHSELWA